MSHNYPYRRPQPDSGLRSDPGSYVSSDRRHSSPDRQIYQAPQESYSYPSSSSSSRVAQWSQDGAVNILSSCGLEPGDLALLAEMPEDRLTVETLPQVLQQIKGKRGTVRQYAHNAPSSSSSSSYPPSSTRRPIVKPTTSDWDRPPSQLLQYQVDQVKSSPLLPELDRWGNPITFSSVRAEQTPSSSSSTSSSYVVDFHHRPAPPDYGKNCRHTSPVSSQDYSNKSKTLEFIKPGREGRQVTSQDYHHRPAPLQFGLSDRDASPASSQDYYNRLGPPDFGKAGRDVQVFPQERPSFSSVGRDRTSRPFSQLSGPADYRPPPLLEDSHLKPLWGGSGSETLSTKSSSQPNAVMPSKQNAMDFHGTTPSMYPHSCSLCAITVMSEKVWLKHINGPHHADGQLSLLQKFPNWDCRLETVGRVDNQPERWKDDRKPGEKPQSSNRNSNSSQQHKKTQKKVSEKSKVVCVKFPAHSVDEKYLKKLAEPFGRIVKILMFPSLAFVELGSMDQAKDMVKFQGNYPPTVNGQQMEFTISHTFNFLQSSRVVSFTPPPTGEEGQSDLISIIKRFGSPLYTLFLPSKSFVEMKETGEAQKLVDYYSSNSLRINDDLIKVSFSGEYKSLMRVPSAKRYEEETRGTRSSSKEKEEKKMESKRMRSSSKEKEEKKTERDRKRSSRDRDKSGTRNRSRSREKSDKEKRGETRTRSKSKEETSRTRSRSSDKSRGDRRTRTRSKSKEKDINEKKSEAKEESSRERSSRSESDLREKSVKEEETEAFVTTESSSDPDPFKDSNPETAENEQMEEEAQSSADESDIEGMEVIGEDGESLQDEEMETLDDADVEEEEHEEEERDHKKDEEQEAEETAEKDECPAERTDSHVEDQEKNEESDHREQQEEKQMEEEEQQNCLKEDEIEEENPLKQAEEAQSTREAEEMTETQPEEDESDFPVDLDSCITLDELEEDECDYLDEEVRHESESPASRVLYLKNVPLDSFSDGEFIRLVRGYGTAVHFFRIPGRHSGFIEMSSSSEAQRAIKGLKDKPVRVNGSRIYAMISSNYTRLSKGWTVESLLDSEEENKSRSQGSRRSGRLKKAADRDEPSRKSEGRKQSSKKTPEKESSSRKSEEKESRTTRKRSSEKESASKQNPEKVSRTSPEKKAKEKESASKHSAKESHDKKSEENESASKTDKKRVDKNNSSETDRSEKNDPEKTPEKSSRRTPERESSSRKIDEKESKTSKRKSSEKESKPRKSLEESSDKPTDEKSSETESKIEESSLKRTPETESKQKKSNDSDSIQTPEKDSGSEMSQNKTIKRKGARENDSVPEKKGKKNESEGESEPADAPEGEELEIQETPEPGLKESGSPHPPGSTGNPAKLKCEQKPDADGLKDSEVNMESQSEPTGGAVEPQKPVGTEFVRPVVGYFCNLCQLIYADEDEAKQQHCSSLEHYRKYQEKTGKDPWAS